MDTKIKISLLMSILIISALLTSGFSFDSSEQGDLNEQNLKTSQVWAVQVEAAPGETGTLEQDFEAANGPYDGEVDKDSADEVDKDSFGLVENDDGTKEVVRGEDYVGDYFHVEQLAHTTGGTLKRYINLSSPWSHGYLSENMSVEGKAKVEESFSMENLAPGTGTNATWHDLF